MSAPRTIPANTSLLLVGTSSFSKTFILPTISTNPGRLLIFKDIYGSFSTSSVFLSTTGIDGFENNGSTMKLDTNYGAWTLMNDAVTRWFLVDSYKNTMLVSTFSGVATVAGISYLQSGTAAPTLGLFGIGPWGSGSGFVDSSAYWIWNISTAASDAPSGIYFHFNRQITVSSSTPAVLHVISDNGGTAYLNTVSLGGIADGGWGTTAYPRFSITLLPGTNLIDLYCSNAGGPAGVIASVIRVSDSAVLLRTDSSWVYY